MDSKTKRNITISIAALVPLVLIGFTLRSPLPSAGVWLALELTILVCWLSAAIFSVVGWRKRPPLFKWIALITFLVAITFGPLVMLRFL